MHSTKSTEEQIRIADQRIKDINNILKLPYKPFSKPDQLTHKKTTKQFQNEKYTLKEIVKDLTKKQKIEAKLTKKKNNKPTHSHQSKNNRTCDLEPTCKIL